jgi:molecular chaperone GrpE
VSSEQHEQLTEEEGVATDASSSEGAAASDGRPDTADSRVESPTDEEARAEDAAVEAPEPDWKDLAHRYAAEADNARKQTAQRVQKASRDGMKRVASEILPALDDFERALAHAEAEEGDEEHTLTRGIRLVQEQMLAALRRAGIESFSPKGEPFDPHLHEAVATTPVEGAESGTVVEVYQAGYRLGDDVLRAAKVVVAA